MFSSVKTVAFWAFILLCLVLLWGMVQRNAGTSKRMEIAYSDLLVRVQNGEVVDAVIQGNQLRGHLKASPKDQFLTTLPSNYDDLEKAMLAAKVNFSLREPQHNLLAPLLVNVGSFAVLITAAILTVPPFWIIFKKAGFQPMLSILMLVPFVNLVVLYRVAFSRWKASSA